MTWLTVWGWVLGLGVLVVVGLVFDLAMRLS